MRLVSRPESKNNLSDEFIKLITGARARKSAHGGE